MKKIIILLIALMVVIVGFLSGCEQKAITEPEELEAEETIATFTLNSWEITDKEGYTCLYIDFDVTDNAKIRIFNPNNEQILQRPILSYSKDIDSFTHVEYVYLSEEPWVSIKLGKYHFIVEKDKEAIFENDFLFSINELTIKSIEYNFEKIKYTLFPEYGYYFTLYISYISMTNMGDVPIYPSHAEGNVDGIEGFSWEPFSSDFTILPGKTIIYPYSGYARFEDDEIGSGDTHSLILHVYSKLWNGLYLKSTYETTISASY